MNEPRASIGNLDFIGNTVGFVIGLVGYFVWPKYMRKRIAEGKTSPKNEGMLKWVKLCFLGWMAYCLMVIVLSMLGKW